MTGHVYVLGVSMSSHDRSAAVLRDGTVLAAVAEERLDRRKKSQGFYSGAGHLVLPPLAAITAVLKEAGIQLDEVSLVVCGRSITTCREELLRYLPIDADKVVEPAAPSHHLGHAYSAYATAPFPACDVLVIDEQGHHLRDGTFEKCTWFTGAGRALQVRRRFLGRGGELSLGMFFDVFAALTGLSEAGLPAAGKLMALAATGRPRPQWPALIHLEESGDVRIELRALTDFLLQAHLPLRPGYEGWQPQTVEDLRLMFQPVHWDTALARDLARTAQDELERAVLHQARTLQRASGARYLAYAGGVALNCTANSRLKEAGYRDVFIHPAATDDGVAVGLAAYGWIEVLGHARPATAPFSAFLGPAYPAHRTRQALDAAGLGGHDRRVGPQQVAERIADGALVCWFTGRSEWGPRALGARSILADPTAPGVVARLNAEVKYREPFRPFGLSIAAGAQQNLLETAAVPASLERYMLAVARVRDPRLAPVQHTDGTIRYQVVHPDQEAYHQLLLALGERTGLRAVLNTSFNTYGEPLVETPDDAIRQFLLCGADALYLDGTLIELAALPAEVRRAACRDAHGATAFDPLRLALQQEAAGFPAAARTTLDLLTVSLSLGPERLRDRAALLMRLALDGYSPAGCGPADAVHHAGEVLRWSGMPPVAAAAATALARHAQPAGCADPAAVLGQDAAALLAALAPQGRAAPTLRAVFAPDNLPAAP
ncbi:carbamoyltransferase C-terminal domain-containing protein [Streptomyces sp. NPDC057654]|uniref:carbamoyltransferase C-terminal domain-containing protein n=1 Tax=Streptomyces sp. NPDC057654 TaxID=3346196 RepID=UPI0036C2720F